MAAGRPRRRSMGMVGPYAMAGGEVNGLRGTRRGLESSPNPIAKVVLAHLKAIQTRGNPHDRRAWKFRLVRGLYERGFSVEDVRRLFRLIDWLMELPPPIQDDFEQEVDEYQETRRMPFVTGFERRGMLKAIERALRVKFGEEGAALVPAIRELNDADKYLTVLDALMQADTLDEVRRACTKAASRTRRRQKD